MLVLKYALVARSTHSTCAVQKAARPLVPRALCALSLRGLASHGSELTGTGLTTFLRAEVEITCYMKRFIFNGTSPNHMWACPFKITVSHGHAGCGASTAGKERRIFLEISISHDIHCHQSDSMKACSESLKCTARCGASAAGTERRALLKFQTEQAPSSIHLYIF